MNKKQLVKKLSQKTGLTLAQSNDFLNSVLDIVSDTLKKKEDVFILVDDVDFGSAHFQIGIFLSGLFKKLVIYIELDYITLDKS